MKLSKLIGIALGVACVAILTIGVLLASGVGSRISGPDEVPERPSGDALAVNVEPFDGEATIRHHGTIAERPLFNEDRQPVIDSEVVGEDDPDDPPPPEFVNLDVAVNGIIIGPDLRMAILTDNRSNERMRVREGMPLENDLAGWTLTEVQPRELLFNGEGMGEARVELVVDAKGAPAVPQPTPILAGNAQASRASDTSGREAEDGKEGDEEGEEEPPRPTSTVTADENGRPVFASNPDAAAQAEEIRRRVAERRAQLRAEAERRRAEQDQDR